MPLDAQPERCEAVAHEKFIENLQRRRNLVYDGNPPPEKDEEDIPELKIKPRAEGDEPAKPTGAGINAPQASAPAETMPVSNVQPATPVTTPSI